jgi:hypothetical protein
MKVMKDHKNAKFNPGARKRTRASPKVPAMFP